MCRMIKKFTLCLLAVFVLFCGTVAVSATSSKSYVGNKSTKVYHMAKCPYVDRMLEENRVYFNTRDAAERKGYRACNYCKDGIVGSGSSNGNYTPETKPTETDPATTDYTDTENIIKPTQQGTQKEDLSFAIYFGVTFILVLLFIVLIRIIIATNPHTEPKLKNYFGLKKHRKGLGKMKKNTLSIIGATAAYWALLFFGPAIIMLFNNIGYYFSGGGYGPDSFMYKVLQFLSQPLSVFIAYSAAKSICNNIKTTSILINTIIAVCILVALAFAGFIVENTSNAIQMVVSCIACIVTAFWASKDIKNIEESTTESTHLES